MPVVYIQGIPRVCQGCIYQVVYTQGVAGCIYQVVYTQVGYSLYASLYPGGIPPYMPPYTMVAILPGYIWPSIHSRVHRWYTAPLSARPTVCPAARRGSPGLKKEIYPGYEAQGAFLSYILLGLLCDGAQSHSVSPVKNG